MSDLLSPKIVALIVWMLPFIFMVLQLTFMAATTLVRSSVKVVLSDLFPLRRLVIQIPQLLHKNGWGLML